MNTIQGSILQTHVFTGSIHEGLQWAIYNATHVYGVSLRDYRLKPCNEK